MAGNETKVEIKGIKNPEKLESFEKALPSIFAMGSTRNLIKAASKGDVDKYSQYMNNYKWPGTTDYNMALNILSPVVAGAQAVINMAENQPKGLNRGQRAIGEKVEAVLQNIYFTQLCDAIGKGDGPAIKDILGKFASYQDLLKELDVAKYATKENAFFEQAGKITGWIINGKYIKQKLLPFIKETLDSKFGDAINRGMQKTKAETKHLSLDLDKKSKVLMDDDGVIGANSKDVRELKESTAYDRETQRLIELAPKYMKYLLTGVDKEAFTDSEESIEFLLKEKVNRDSLLSKFKTAEDIEKAIKALNANGKLNNIERKKALELLRTIARMTGAPVPKIDLNTKGASKDDMPLYMRPRDWEEHIPRERLEKRAKEIKQIKLNFQNIQKINKLAPNHLRLLFDDSMQRAAIKSENSISQMWSAEDQYSTFLGYFDGEELEERYKAWISHVKSAGPEKTEKALELLKLLIEATGKNAKKVIKQLQYNNSMRDQTSLKFWFDDVKTEKDDLPNLQELFEDMPKESTAANAQPAASRAKHLSMDSGKKSKVLMDDDGAIGANGESVRELKEAALPEGAPGRERKPYIDELAAAMTDVMNGKTPTLNSGLHDDNHRTLTVSLKKRLEEEAPINEKWLTGSGRSDFETRLTKEWKSDGNDGTSLDDRQEGTNCSVLLYMIYKTVAHKCNVDIKKVTKTPQFLTAIESANKDDKAFISKEYGLEL